VPEISLKPICLAWTTNANVTIEEQSAALLFFMRDINWKRSATVRRIRLYNGPGLALKDSVFGKPMDVA